MSDGYFHIFLTDESYFIDPSAELILSVQNMAHTQIVYPIYTVILSRA